MAVSILFLCAKLRNPYTLTLAFHLTLPFHLT